MLLGRNDYGGSLNNPENLHHLDLDIHAGGKIQVGQRIDGLWRRIQNIDETLVHAHFILFSGVFMHKARSVDRIFMHFCRKRHRPYHLGSVADGRIYDLLDRIINYLRIVSSNFDAKAGLQFLLLFRCQGTGERL